MLPCVKNTNPTLPLFLGAHFGCTLGVGLLLPPAWQLAGGLLCVLGATRGCCTGGMHACMALGVVAARGAMGPSAPRELQWTQWSGHRALALVMHGTAWHACGKPQHAWEHGLVECGHDPSLFALHACMHKCCMHMHAHPTANWHSMLQPEPN